MIMSQREETEANRGNYDRILGYLRPFELLIYSRFWQIGSSAQGFASGQQELESNFSNFNIVCSDRDAN